MKAESALATENLLRRISSDEVFVMQTFLRIVDEQKKKVPFRLANRPMQKDFVDRVIKTGVTKAVELKARRVGGTSLFMALGLTRCLLRKNYAVLLLAQSDPDSREFMKKGFQAYYRDMVPDVTMPDGSIFHFKLPLKTDSDHEIAFEKTNSYICVATAGSKKYGRGGGYDMVIGTEVARWDTGRAAGTAEETWAMVEGAVGDRTNYLLIQESTAFGAAGFFYDTYQAAKAGTNGFLPLFYDWRWHPAYQYPEGDMRALEADRGPLELSEEEVKLGLTIGQARWRRSTLAGLRGMSLFLQEYPEDDVTCFAVSGDPYFDTQMLDAAIGNSRPAISVNQSGRLKIWCAPVVGEKYLIGVDVGGSASEKSRAERDLDYDAAVVYDSRLQHVATLHGRFDTRTLADIVVGLAQYYNGAFVIPEAGPYGEAFIQVLTLILNYDNVYYEKDQAGKARSVGLRMTEMSKPPILESLKDAFEHGVLRTDDKDLLNEMRNFHRAPTASGHVRLEARSGHDDLVMATALVTWAWLEGKFGRTSRFKTKIYYPDGRLVESGGREGFASDPGIDRRDLLADLSTKA